MKSGGGEVVFTGQIAVETQMSESKTWQRAREPENQRSREPESQRAREAESQRAREPVFPPFSVSQRAREPESQRACNHVSAGNTPREGV